MYKTAMNILNQYIATSKWSKTIFLNVNKIFNFICIIENGYRNR